MSTGMVENFPGFAEGISGPVLMEQMQAQAERWGTTVYLEDVTWVDISQHPFRLSTADQQLQALSLIIATGSRPRRLGLPREEEFWGRTISSCAMCDGNLPHFADVPLGVVGGGDASVEEAIYLSRYASRVHLLVRGSRLRASQTMQERLFRNPKILVRWRTRPIELLGSNGVIEGVRLEDCESGAVSCLSLKGLFYAIGHIPNTSLFRNQLELDENGYIVTVPGSAITSKDGVFAAGDAQDHEFRQAITAAGSGCIAALQAERWLSAQGFLQPLQSSAADPPAAPEKAPTPGADDQVDLKVTRHWGGRALRQLYHESSRLLVVKYASCDCGPCHILKPILDKIVAEFAGQIHYVEIDIQKDKEVVAEAGIVGTPTVQFFKHKELLGEIKGLRQKNYYREAIQAWI